MEKKVHADFVYSLIIWLHINNKVKTEIEADTFIIDFCYKNGKNLKAIAIGWSKVFAMSRPRDNKDRMINIIQKCKTNK